MGRAFPSKTRISVKNTKISGFLVIFALFHGVFEGILDTFLSFGHTGPHWTTTGRTAGQEWRKPLSNPYGKCLKLSKFHENMVKMSLFGVSGLSVTFWRKVSKTSFFMKFSNISRFCWKPMGKPEGLRTVGFYENQRCLRGVSKIGVFRQKRQKRQFGKNLWRLGRLFCQKVQFWHPHFWPQKVVFLDL